MTYTKRICELTRQQKKYYKEMKNEMMIAASGEEVTAVNAAVNLNKLLQLSSGALYTDNGETLEFDISNRYNVLKEIIEESEKKVLIFAQFKHIIEMLNAKLNEEGIATAIINGSVSASKRTAIFKRFQEDSDPQVLVIQPQAAAHGVTLTEATTVVWWGPTSSLETYAQANARIHRAGQTCSTTVIQLEGSRAEKHVYDMLDNKMDIHSGIIDLYKALLD
jgi:SNF2 family DNA or RNA helicase